MFIGGSVNLADAYLDESDRILTRSNASNPSNDIDFLAGRIWLTNGSDRRLYTNSGTITKKLNTAFAVGHNQGMLDTGTVGNNSYHLYAIGNSSGTIDFLASLSLTAPTMPTGFSYRKRVASITRVSGANRQYTQIGRYFQFPEDIVTLNGYAVSTSGELIVMPVPAGIRVRLFANFYAGFGDSNALTIKVLDGDLSIASLANSGSNAFRGTSFVASGYISMTECSFVTNTSGQLYFRRSGNYYNSSYQTVLQVHGYEDINL